MAARHSTTHMSINRHKRSMTLNLRCDTGCEVFYKILPSIDTFVDGFACERLGMSYEASRKATPDIVDCQTNEFGTPRSLQSDPFLAGPPSAYVTADPAGRRQILGLTRQISSTGSSSRLPHPGGNRRHPAAPRRPWPASDTGAPRVPR
jgi:hypothetical protein